MIRDVAGKQYFFEVFILNKAVLFPCRKNSLSRWTKVTVPINSNRVVRFDGVIMSVKLHYDDENCLKRLLNKCSTMVYLTNVDASRRAFPNYSPNSI